MKGGGAADARIKEAEVAEKEPYQRQHTVPRIPDQAEIGRDSDDADHHRDQRSQEVVNRVAFQAQKSSPKRSRLAQGGTGRHVCALRGFDVGGLFSRVWDGSFHLHGFVAASQGSAGRLFLGRGRGDASALPPGVRIIARAA